MNRTRFEKQKLGRAHNKAVIGTFFASLRFGVATPLYPKTSLHKNAPYSGVIRQHTNIGFRVQVKNDFVQIEGLLSIKA